jgi:CheY-like chemotaxis protein
MLDAYMNEIIAGVAVVVLIIIYFLLKKSHSNKKVEIEPQEPIKEKIEEKKEEDVKLESKSEKEVDAVVQTKIENIQEKTKYVKIDSLSGKEEGSFGVEDEEQVSSKVEEKQTYQLVRNKKAVPPHAKITKNDFKEFAGKRILVAEDNLINQKVISGLLADTGIELVMADDGQIALDILEQDSNFQFILMDAHMPRIDGFEATRQIRKIPAYNHIVIIALSGDTAADDIKKMSDAGMEEHLEKPLRMDSLYDILYIYSDDQSVSSEGSISDMQELDIQEGLIICGDDEEFYKEILTQFINTYADSSSKLEKLFQSANMQEASQYLLDISGIAANIGANNISNLAKELRESIKNPKDSKYLEIFKNYTKSLHTLINEIDRYMK